jgi:thioredoxin 1
MASNKVHVFNDINFDQEVLKADKPVLVDFTATIDEAPVTAGKYGVRGVPTLMVFRGGQRSAQHVGLTTKQKLKDLIGG